MIWLKENRMATIIIFILSFWIIFIYASFESDNQNSQIDTTRQIEPYEKSVKLESIYKSSKLLPVHNTVCFPAKKILCNRGICENVEPSVFNLLISRSESASLEPAIARCDSKGCDVYDARFEPSGREYINIQPIDPKGMILKMTIGNTEPIEDYLEVVTLGLDTHISYGYCLFNQ